MSNSTSENTEGTPNTNTLNANMLCTCECLCEGKKKMIKGDERLIHFLMGLNDTYAPARGNILMLNPLPTENQLSQKINSTLNRKVDLDLDLTINKSLEILNSKETHLTKERKATNYAISANRISSKFQVHQINKFQGTVTSNSATSMEELDGNQSILAFFENPNIAQQLSPNQFTKLVHLLKHIQEGKSVGSEVSVNSATDQPSPVLSPAMDTNSTSHPQTTTTPPTSTVQDP
ncbi:hypothetical protein H5410_052433 [Solanum commersonii]|uniref:Uncharacterized protein n=1 Tax=Solanum commersonii TaxID=4109 RepID=A0A9J5X3L3_SOLCO|nr:hypothetical protein H5410_052433 [Solanum commersonii]